MKLENPEPMPSTVPVLLEEDLTTESEEDPEAQITTVVVFSNLMIILETLRSANFKNKLRTFFDL